MEQQFSKNTLFNFFSGHATPLQKKVIEEWLEKESNRELFFDWLREWENEYPQFLADADQAFERFRMNVRAGSDLPSRLPLQKKRRRPAGFWLAAASVLILVASVPWFFKDTLLYQTHATTFGEVKNLTLPDGSRVALNANTRLRLPRFGFGSSERHVYLDGEAEFSVRHMAADRKFVVHTPDRMLVEVLGTRFVVYSRARGSKVALQTGKVKISNAAKQSLTIAPGDVITLDRKGTFRKQTQPDVQVYSSWKQRRFVFARTSLAEIAYLIEENFGVKVSIADTALAKRSVSGTFQAGNAQEMLDMLADVSNLSVIRHNQTYSITAAE